MLSTTSSTQSPPNETSSPGTSAGQAISAPSARDSLHKESFEPSLPIVCGSKRKVRIQYPVPHPVYQGKGQQTRQFLPTRCRTAPQGNGGQPQKVDTVININTTVLPQTGLFVCANIVLLCRAFAQVQSTSPTATDVHPTPFLFSAAIKLGNIITSQSLQDAIAGNSEQTSLVLYTVLECLDTITMCIRKEASNPDTV